jgi:hypothetical protein
MHDCGGDPKVAANCIDRNRSLMTGVLQQKALYGSQCFGAITKASLIRKDDAEEHILGFCGEESLRIQRPCPKRT